MMHTFLRFQLLLMLCLATQVSAEPAGNPINSMPSLVSVEWLHQHLNDTDLVVLDCSVIVTQQETGELVNLSGLDNFNEGHIPNAGFADLMGELRDESSHLDFALPSPEEFARVMAALGVGDKTRVVLYDSYNSAWAARVWWMLRWIGFDQVAILDGGLAAWKAADLPLSTEAHQPVARTLSVKLRPHLIADRDEVYEAVSNGDVRIIDSLPEAHYRGEMVMYARPGHIKGAENRSIMQLQDEPGYYRSTADLDDLFSGDRQQRAITYCGGGIAASSVAFTMHRLGFKDIAVYAASLEEWALDPRNPMEIIDEFGEAVTSE